MSKKCKPRYKGPVKERQCLDRLWGESAFVFKGIALQLAPSHTEHWLAMKVIHQQNRSFELRNLGATGKPLRNEGYRLFSYTESASKFGEVSWTLKKKKKRRWSHNFPIFPSPCFHSFVMHLIYCAFVYFSSLKRHKRRHRRRSAVVRGIQANKPGSTEEPNLASNKRPGYLSSSRCWFPK